MLEYYLQFLLKVFVARLYDECYVAVNKIMIESFF